MSHTIICRLDNAGDVLLAGPATRAIAAGSDRVTFLAGPRGAEAAAMLPGVDEVIVHRAAWIDPGGATVDADAIAGLISAVKSRSVGEAAILTSFHQSPLPAALLLRLAGVGTIAAISEDYAGTLLDIRHRVDPGEHEVMRALSLVATLGYRLPAGDDGRLHVVDPPGHPVPSLVQRPYVVVHPGSSASARTAPPDRFIEIATALAGDGWVVAVTGGSQELELTGRVASAVPGGVDLGGATSLPQLAAVIESAAVVVSGNTGPAHLAAAVGTPVVQLFAPTVPAARWHPWGVPHRILGNQAIACAGCRATACPVPTQPCLADISCDEVVEAVRSVVSDRDYRAPAAAVIEMVTS